MSSAFGGFWRRLAANLLDGLLFAALLTPLTLLLADAVPMEILGSWLLPLALTLGCWMMLGGTPGKLLMGCELVDGRSGHRVSLGQALLRYLGYLLSALPLGLGFLWILWDRRKQGFHDKLAGTLVIREDERRLSLDELERRLR